MHRDQRGGYAGEVLRGADGGLRGNQGDQHAESQQDGPAGAERLNMTARDLLYARADVIGGIDDPRLLELELIEPSLGWMRLGEQARELQQREFARCLASALERLGLGPLSHRRP